MLAKTRRGKMSQKQRPPFPETNGGGAKRVQLDGKERRVSGEKGTRLKS